MHPYTNLPDRAFWKTAIANKNMFDIDGLWIPKFGLSRRDKIATFGSCFAQHIGKALTANGYAWLNTEPTPFGLALENAKKFNYNVFTCRTGNIYTTSLLRQWVEWASKNNTSPAEYWLTDTRFYDPFRPNIEPNGYQSEQEMFLSRQATINNFKSAITQSNIFIFTLGLTESWFNGKNGYEYPMCPGTVAGSFNPQEHVFVNQKFNAIKDNLENAILMMRQLNAGLRFILTVSPVPLTATNSGNHVLAATLESKSILRAVAGELIREYDFIDYFPSYEIINAPPFKGVFFEANQRSVGQHGVDFVMHSFFQSLKTHPEHAAPEARPHPVKSAAATGNQKSADELVCEELILESFNRP